MTTFFLAFLVVLINFLIYGLQGLQYYGVTSHLYYGVMILAGIYDEYRGQRILLILTALTNWLYVILNYNQTNRVLIPMVVATLYPFIAYFIVRTIGQAQRAPSDHRTADWTHQRSKRQS